MEEDIRTSGFKSQNEYDVLLSNLDISSLRFLSWKYNRDLIYFKANYNINEQINAQSYKKIQQRKKMIDEEIYNRKMWEERLEIEDE